MSPVREMAHLQSWEKLRLFRATSALVVVMPVSLGLVHLVGSKLSLTSNTLILLVLVAVFSIGNPVWISVAVAVESFLFLNYFLTPPYHSFRIRNSDDLISLLVFLFASISVSLILRALTTRRHEVEYLVAKIENTLHRDSGVAQNPTYQLGGWEIDLKRRIIEKPDSNGKQIHLTPTEWKILEVMLVSEGDLVGQKEILQQVWGEKYSSETNYLRLYMSQLRKKLESNPKRPELILTEPGVGYRITASKNAKFSQLPTTRNSR